MSDRQLALGIDIGGTKIAGGIVDESGVVLDCVRRETPGHAVDAVEEAIVSVVDELCVLAESRSYGMVIAVGVGAAGWVSTDRSTVLFSPHLAWRNTLLRADLRDRMSLPLWVDNDANAAAWAEYRFGAACGHDTAACVTLGTGIGGGVISGGHLQRGAFGVAGEWGHTRVVPGGRRCVCGNRGCWEQYASGRALARAGQELVEVAPAAASGLLARVNGDASRLTGADVTAAALAGDPAAIGLVQEVGTWLGEGLVTIAMIIDPSVIVVGGGVSALGELLLGPARERFTAALPGLGYRPVPEIVEATLGPDAGMIGAADLARTAGLTTHEERT
ncbi:MAG: ROK family glucokinase [Actinomycetota bacterium]|nr:ROK family glucokinase [Actinomycetota bacterium]